MLRKAIAKQILTQNIIHNRKFYERMRSKYFKKVRYIFNKLYRLFDEQKASLNISYLYEYFLKLLPELDNCIYYSTESLWGYESGVIPNYSTEYKYGILEEEKIFKLMIEEFYSLILFLENFISTEYGLINYKTSVLKLKKKSFIKSGFIDNLTKKLDDKSHISLLKAQLDFLVYRLKTINEIHKIIINNHKYILENKQ